MKLYGHDIQIAAFKAAMAGERMHHAWLLAGPRGVGKGSFAQAAALRLLAEASGRPLNLLGNDKTLEVPEDHPAAHLMSAGSHPDFRHLQRIANDKGNLARNITIDQVRGLRTLFATGTSMGDRRVILIDSIDDMERGAANAILKSLEEPPETTVFLLVSHAPGRLLPTIRSRCRMLMFAPLNEAAMTSVLTDHLPDLSVEKIASLLAGANGLPAAALGAAQLDLAAFETTLNQLATTGDPTNAIRTGLAQSLALKAALPRYEAFLMRAPTFIATRARISTGPALERALVAWGRARTLSAIAIPQSLVAETVVFEMAGYVASLADW
ncbi:AAA family ATPase [Sphingomonas paeninsulae]|uniref:AAA family ATPase n=1 Tax=Sphingomonas paeninsulae TaxID=2319844 RepID=A0A494TEF1_SPHPE|nr:AAA family ATPase [Sphingomonas paeninsulae]AYJ85652.1 AAA family ATPase [Sphingomonas paeninsulae]